MNKRFWIWGMLLTSIIYLASCNSTSENTSSSEENQSDSTAVETVTKVDPDVIFENEYVKVVKVSLQAGEELAAHSGNKRLVYSLSDYAVTYFSNHEKGIEETFKKGDAHFHKADEHSAKNNGSTTAEWLAFVIQTSEMPAAEEGALEKDVNSVAKDFANIVFENDDFRMTELKLPAGEKIPAHDGPNRLIYSLSDYTIRYEADGAEAVEEKFKEGDIHWHETGSHSLENISEQTANFLIVGFK